MKRLVLVGVLVAFVAACDPAPAPDTTTTTSSTTTTSTTEPPPEVRTCPPPPYEIDFLPALVGDPGFDPSDIEPDVWTSTGGTYSTLIGRSDGTVAIALIRGTLPAVDWPGQKGAVEIDGVEGVAGPHPDGIWSVGWYVEPAERCDLYSMVFYPPWNPRDIEQVLLSMRRIPG